MNNNIFIIIFISLVMIRINEINCNIINSII